MHNQCLVIHNYACKRCHLVYSAVHNHNKSSSKIPVWFVGDFSRKGKKVWKNPINYALFMPNYPCSRYHFHWLGAHHLIKVLWEVLAWSLQDFSSKGGKMEKTHKLCLFMLVNAS